MGTNRLLTLERGLSRVKGDNEREKNSDWSTVEEGWNRRDVPGDASLHRGPEYDCGTAEVWCGGGKPDKGEGGADLRRAEHTGICAGDGRRFVLRSIEEGKNRRHYGRKIPPRQAAARQRRVTTHRKGRSDGADRKVHDVIDGQQFLLQKRFAIFDADHLTVMACQLVHFIFETVDGEEDLALFLA